MNVFLATLMLLTSCQLALGEDQKKSDIIEDTVGIEDLKYIDSIGKRQMTLDYFIISDGFGGYSYKLDSVGVFIKTDFSCLDTHISDSGTYHFKNNRHIEFISKYEHLVFNVFQFDKFLLLIPPRKTAIFKKEFLALCKTYNNLPPVKRNDEKYTDQFFIVFSLKEKYLINGLD